MLLPTHEQGFLFARVAERLAGKVAFALPSFENYRAAHSKAGFSRLLDRLGLPQPRTQIVTSESELRASIKFPAVIKTSVGTASRGVWLVRTEGDLLPALYELAAGDAFADEVLVQDLIAGTTEKAQSVFCRGRLIGFHAYRQVAAGVGGGEAIKQSVSRPVVREYLEKIGAELAWHGGLSVDTIMPYDGTAPLLIDCNPRLVEPVNAWRSGSDLVGLLLRVSQGETPEPLPDGREGVLDASCHAGAARSRLARRDADRNHKGMRAAADGRRALCRQQRGNDAGAARLDQRRAARDDRDVAAGLAGVCDDAREGRLWRASARCQEYSADREGGFSRVAA